ncbi:MAG: pyrroloquinoline quinone (PQQ) biosynthesis protein C [Lysobacterales bacterium]|jgi:pyrroloquinoline quinone (PQQ) biosynthesis protein C
MTYYKELLQATEKERNALLATPVITDCMRGMITLDTYQAFLVEAYHHVRYTVPLLMACGSRLPRRLEWLREAVGEYIEEETGHQEWILNDIDASGGDKEAVRGGKPTMATDIMVAYAWDSVQRRNPVGFFGMVLVLEGTSVRLATEAAGIIQKKLELPNKAFSYLSSHGSLDIEHIAFYEKLINQLEEPDDREAVLRTARVIYSLYAGVFNSLPRSMNQQQAA